MEVARRVACAVLQLFVECIKECTVIAALSEKFGEPLIPNLRQVLPAI